MKLRVLSDLHLEFQDWRPPKAPADVIVLAGDIHAGIDGILWGRTHFPESPVIYVPGNHEFYGREMQATLTELRHAAKTHRVHMLDGDAVVVEGVRILGATLWTDFALYGAEPSVVARAKAIAQQAMADYYVIRRRDGRRDSSSADGKKRPCPLRGRCAECEPCLRSYAACARACDAVDTWPYP
jgi:3',5'-cyclic AMP phosphodiesterase CpdA